MKALLYSLTLLLFALGAQAGDPSKEPLPANYAFDSVPVQPALEPVSPSNLDAVLPASARDCSLSVLLPLPVPACRAGHAVNAVLHSIRAPPPDLT